ncbi:EAL domain-containing protein [Variovorax saccharolyticus]|uniref:EAL domain-containing protein n=1 Tax=Variovorax saccharolyticus TaxID=3053516 RepID=UPI0025788EE6|nr:EAL domain-containing protein [Variovorax sp. J22R187]MDM0019467.1 EAL domain-containing protein [Variovorax sp. J22R187]
MDECHAGQYGKAGRRCPEARSGRYSRVSHKAQSMPHQARKRTQVIVVAVALAVGAVAVPVAAMFYLAWARAVRDEQEQLAEVAGRVILRTRRTMDETAQALWALEPLRTAPCSPEHIAQMQAATLNTISVQEMGFFEDDLLKCTSWGITTQTVHQGPIDAVTKDGVKLSRDVLSVVRESRPLLAMRYGNHNVLIDPARLVDVVIDPAMQLAVATHAGALLATRNAPDPAQVRHLVGHPGKDLDDSHVMVSTEDGDVVAVVLGPRSRIADDLARQQRVLLPIGVAMGGFMAAGVVWLSRRRLSLSGELAIAIRNREFCVHYQPLIELRTGRCVGAEALVRWQLADGSYVKPDLFIPVAEETGQIVQITEQVIAAVGRDLGAALAADRTLHVAINLSARDLEGECLLGLLDDLTRRGIEPRQVWLEVTERGFVDDGAPRAWLDKARAAGYVVAIDDFGTGYSSLSYLQKLPIDALKIDKSFVDTVGLETVTACVAPHIIELAKELRFMIVAEGVETQAQADYLLAHGVDYAQGWLYAKAMPVEEFLVFANT